MARRVKCFGSGRTIHPDNKMRKAKLLNCPKCSEAWVLADPGAAVVPGTLPLRAAVEIPGHWYNTTIVEG